RTSFPLVTRHLPLRASERVIFLTASLSTTTTISTLVSISLLLVDWASSESDQLGTPFDDLYRTFLFSLFLLANPF
ncbi:hypothetical protein BD310DRAFT_939463, partial [Dichomitus squalens]